MELIDWLKKENINQAKLAAGLGISQSAVSQMLNGVIKPDRDTGKAITVFTRNEVSFEEAMFPARQKDAA